MSSNPPGWGTPGVGNGWQTNPGPGTPPPPGFPQTPSVGYGQQGIGFAREHPDGTTVLILGILSLVVCQVLGPFAWIKGNSALREIDANPGMYTNRGTVSAGRICGIVASALMILSVVIVVIAILIAVAGSSTT